MFWYSTQLVAVIRLEAAMLNAEDKIHQHGRQQPQAQNRRTPFLVVDAFDITPLADFIHTPNVQDRTVQQRHHRNDSEDPRRGEGHIIAAEI